MRLELHLARMENSARTLGIPFDSQSARDMTNCIGDSIDGGTALRCRMTLDRCGRIALTTADLPPGIGIWRLAIAKTRLDSCNPWLKHKSTRRQVYDAARADLPKGVDELIFLNERGEVCEGTITNVFAHLFEGPHVTPPLASGLLPGILRQNLLDSGSYTERVITPNDLRRARYIGVGNSLRGTCSAKLV